MIVEIAFSLAVTFLCIAPKQRSFTTLAGENLFRTKSKRSNMDSVGWMSSYVQELLIDPAARATRALKTFLVDKDQDNVSNNLVCAHKRRELKQKRFWSNDSVLGDRINLLVRASLA